MKYCTNCKIEFSGMKLENNECPQCKLTIRVITNQKLIKLLSEINEAMHIISNKSLANNPKDIIELAKTIQNGEKKLFKEYNKKMEQMTDLDYELTVITKFAEKMKYKLQ